MIVQRVEKHIIKKTNTYYNIIDKYCFNAKNLYNHANYIVRDVFCKENKWIRYGELDKILKADLEFDDYKQMPTAQSAQQILKLIDRNWNSFFKAIKDWSKNKDKYLGRPKLPNYKKKDSRGVLILTNQNVRLKDNILYFPKTFKGFTVKTLCDTKNNFVSFQQVRFIPKYNHIILEVVCNIEVQEQVNDNGRYLSIDVGVDNLATVVNNFGKQPFIINGKGLKSINKYYNKQMSHYQEISKRVNSQYQTNRLNSIIDKRNHKIEDYMHKASRYVVNYALNNNVSVIVIGKNSGWKQEVNLGKVTNQTFVQIPFARLIEMITYKALEFGIAVLTHEEAYTSGTSYLDGEQPIKKNYNKKRRVHRGLFKSNTGKLINADVNGAYQIMKKVFPNAISNGIEGVALHPFVVNAFAV